MTKITTEYETPEAVGAEHVHKMMVGLARHNGAWTLVLQINEGAVYSLTAEDVMHLTEGIADAMEHMAEVPPERIAMGDALLDALSATPTGVMKGARSDN